MRAPEWQWEVEPASVTSSHRALMQMLCGLVEIATDGGGDQAWLSTLPGTWDRCRVYRFNHENGQLEDLLAVSVASFLGKRVRVSGHRRASWVGDALKQLTARHRKAGAPGPLDDSRSLYSRCDWLMPLALGHRGFDMARKLTSAPSLAVWREERELVADRPWLANYWVLAHFFLGNDAACRDALEAAGAIRAQVTTALCTAVAAVLDDAAPLGRVDAPTLADLRASVAKNAPDELRQTPRLVSIPEGALPPEAVDAKLRAGEEPWQLILDHPDDVDLHDKALEHLAATDRKLRKQIEAYREGREGRAHFGWDPDDDEAVDGRFSIVCAAAFCRGLQFDADNERANAGVTQMLARFDDDPAICAFERGIAELPVNDDRLRYAIEALVASAHPRADELLEQAARRVFARLDEAAKNDERLAKRRASEGITLDTMFDEQNHLLAALEWCLERGDERAAELASRVLAVVEATGRTGGFRGCWPAALAVAGEHGLSDFAGPAAAVVKGAAKKQRFYPSELFELQQRELCEAALAGARLAPKRVEAALRKLFARETEHAGFDLDVRAAVLGGLMVLDGPTDEYLALLERILGNRSCANRILSGLRVVQALALNQARNWARPHVYTHKHSMDRAHQRMERLARSTMETLGDTDLPPRQNVKWSHEPTTVRQVLAEFGKPHRHAPHDLCDRARRFEIPDELCDVIAAWTASEIRYSADNDGVTGDHGSHGIQALQKAGLRGRQALLTLLELSHVSSSKKVQLMQTLRDSANLAAAWVEAATMPVDEVVERLAQPDARWAGVLDALAARAVLDAPERCEGALAKAAAWRYARAAGSRSDVDRCPEIGRLAALSCLLGDDGRASIESLAAEYPGSDDCLQDVVAEALAPGRTRPEPGDIGPRKKKLRYADGDSYVQFERSGDECVVRVHDEPPWSRGRDCHARGPAAAFETMAHMAEILGYQSKKPR